MNAQDLRNLLEQSNDKFSILADRETLKNYEIRVNEFLGLIKDFLNDDEKLKLFNYPNYLQFKNPIKCGIINTVSDENIKFQMLTNDNITKDFSSFQIVDIIETMSDTKKQALLYKQDFLEKHQISSYDSAKILLSCSEEKRAEILSDSNLITNTLKLEDYRISKLITSLAKDEDKIKVLDMYQLEDYQKIDVLKTCNDNYKINVLLKQNEFSRYNILDLLTSVDSNNLGQFFLEHKEFCHNNNIRPFEIVKSLDEKQQMNFVKNLENMNLSLNEKREILAVLSTEVKQSLNTQNLPNEYKSALDVPVSEYHDRVILDFSRNLEDYRGLDNLLKINPEQFTKEQKSQLMKLCDICPNMGILSTMNSTASFISFSSTAKEYKEAEEWISSVIDNLDPTYSKAQKMAVIDNAIGKKISYSPDFDTEVFNDKDCRALWKIISSGYGVCNGIANVEQYMLRKVGIESELIGSDLHAFLKIKDIELPLANGEIVKGNTILDPTWNLARHRFSARPENFCISYEQARANDIDIYGHDHKSHKNDEKLQDATISLDDKSLRELFKSVGLAQKDGNFPISDLIDKSKQIDELYANQPEKNISEQFSLLHQVCPEFAKCQNSSMTILSSILLNNDNLKFNKCIVDRVYNRNDKEKEPFMYVYIDSDELGKKFYFADKDKGQFSELSQEEFTQQFECYEEDLKLHNRN